MTNRPTGYQGGQLAMDGVPLAEIAARFDTPTFVYSAESIRGAIRHVQAAFAEASPMVAYSVKANTNGAILRLMAREGAAFDIVSGGELMRALRAGVQGSRVIFAGVGKTPQEMELALNAGVHEFNVESVEEARALDSVAARVGKAAPVALRVNPDVAAKTHDYISTGRKADKFGLSLDRALELAARIPLELRHLRLMGVHAHIGSQIMTAEAHEAAAAVLDAFLARLRAVGAAITTLNFGGGFGVDYTGDGDTDLAPLARPIVALARKHGLKLVLEPGRYLVARSGVLLTRVLYRKQGDGKGFAIVDASMTENIRPALYQAFHQIVPVAEPATDAREVVDVVGPVCESSDFLGKDRSMAPLAAGDLLAVLDTGAYCSVMGSNYNSRPLAAEVLVDNGAPHLIRRRQRVQDLFADEMVPFHLHTGSTETNPRPAV